MGTQRSGVEEKDNNMTRERMRQEKASKKVNEQGGKKKGVLQDKTLLKDKLNSLIS